MADHTPVDVEAIQARLDAATARDVGPDDADIDAEMDRVRSARLVLNGLAPTDLRDLLDENARLNTELAEWRQVGARANQGLKDAAAELEARNDEITRMGKEIVKANEGFAAIWAEINTWDLTDEQIDEQLQNVGGVPRVEGWIKLAVKRGNAKALKAILEPAPEMPRPPAEEAQERVSGLERRETRTGVPETLSEAQAIESGRQIAVSMMDRAEAKYRHEHGQPHLREHCEACAEEYWANHLRPVHYREAAASLRAIAAANRDVQSEAYINGIESAAGRLDSVARDLDEEGGTDA